LDTKAHSLVFFIVGYSMLVAQWNSSRK